MTLAGSVILSGCYNPNKDWDNLSKRGWKDRAFQALGGLLRGAALPARGKPRPSQLFYLDLHSIFNRFPYHVFVINGVFLNP